MSPYLPKLLSANAGYVDTAGYLALQGLFTAHVTGNFVTLGAALIHGSSGVLAKLLALPAFCVVLVLARLFTLRWREREITAVRALLIAKLVLLVTAAALAGTLGPFMDGDGVGAIVTGMALVAAMAIQNGLSRIYLVSAPPTTLMTGSTTQMMIDLAEIISGSSVDGTSAAHTRLAKFAPVVAAFAFGCAFGAICFAVLHQWCFLLPALLASVATMDAMRSSSGNPA